MVQWRVGGHPLYKQHRCDFSRDRSSRASASNSAPSCANLAKSLPELQRPLLKKREENCVWPLRLSKDAETLEVFPTLTQHSVRIGCHRHRRQPYAPCNIMSFG